MTPPQPWLARMRIARCTGDAMLCRLGLCAHTDPKGGNSQPASLARHQAAATTERSPLHVRLPMVAGSGEHPGIANTGRRVRPAEADGRPGTAGTDQE